MPQYSNETEHFDRVLRLPQVIATTGLKRSTIYHLISLGGFPRQRRLGASSVGWLQSEIQEWIRQREIRECPAHV
ncbi:Prophage CP4-57 regulatory protein (AlpA) [compost metagenome]